MSATSQESARGAGADIIDLDRYMRAAVKPPRDRRAREQLVVDAGGVARFSDSAPSEPAAAHRKRFSHDSGLSDSSYAPPRHRGHRRSAPPPAPPAARSSPSVMQFRVTCEKALRDQQEQLARVAALCERLARPAGVLPGGGAVPRDSSDSSDVSSSSRSSEERRKGKRRSESCKTYTIIMSKLDELGRLLAARRSSHPPHPSRQSPPSPPSRSVSVSDKLVATEPPRAPADQGARRLGVTHAPALDIAPDALRHCCGGDGSGAPRSTGRARSSRCGLQQTCHLDHSERSSEQERCDSGGKRRAMGDSAGAKAPGAEREEWVCAACRGYWRALCRRLPLVFARS